MAETNLSGPIYGTRSGCPVVRQSKQISGTSSTTATSTGIIVRASTYSPVLIEAQIAVTTLDGGTTPTISFGYTGTGYTDLVNAQSTATAATGGTFLPASNVTGKKIVTTDTEIFYKQGGTPNGTGVTWLILDITTLNPK